MRVHGRYLRVQQLGSLDLGQDSGGERAAAQRGVLQTQDVTVKEGSVTAQTDRRAGGTHCYVEEGVGGQALGEGRGVSVLERSAHVNRRGVVDLRTQRGSPGPLLGGGRVSEMFDASLT